MSVSRASNLPAPHLHDLGNDEKVLWNDDGKTVLAPAGKDSVLIVDLASPENPKIVANLALDNSVVGPPVNVAIDPTGSVALVADSVDVAKDGEISRPSRPSWRRRRPAASNPPA